MSLRDYTPQQIEEILQAFFDVAGTRQYIGARYVPIFGRGAGTSVDWDQSGAYEPLSIVYYQGDTYTSRRYVPAGIDISNTDYWVITGRYNAQVEQYRQEVLGYTARIDGAYSAVDALREEVADDYIPFPDSAHYPKYGTNGQVLTTLANGQTLWQNPVVPSDAQAEEIITQWLADHPEATTTVQDNSLTFAKFADEVQHSILFAENQGWLHEIFITEAGLAAGIEKVHSVVVENNAVRIRFSYDNESSFTGNTTNIPVSACIGLFPIYNMNYGATLGYVVCDLSGFTGAVTNVLKTLYPTAYILDFSPSIHAYLIENRTARLEDETLALNNEVMGSNRFANLSSSSQSVNSAVSIWFRTTPHKVGTIDAIEFSCVKQPINFYKITYVSGASTLEYELLKTFTPSETQYNTIQTIMLDEPLEIDENTYIGINGNFKFATGDTEGNYTRNYTIATQVISTLAQQKLFYNEIYTDSLAYRVELLQQEDTEYVREKEVVLYDASLFSSNADLIGTQTFDSDGLLLPGGSKIVLDKYYSVSDRTLRFVCKFTADARLQFGTAEKSGENYNASTTIKIHADTKVIEDGSLTVYDCGILNSTDLFLISLTKHYQDLILEVQNLGTGKRMSFKYEQNGTGGVGAGAIGTATNVGMQYDYYYFERVAGTIHISQLQVVCAACDVLVYGDSITEPEAYWPNNLFDESWTQLLVKKTGGRVLTSGRSGTSIAQINYRIQNELPFIKPKYCMVTIGTNGGVTEQNLTQLVQYIKSQDVIPIINHIPCGDNNGDTTYFITVNEIVDAVRLAEDVNGCDFDKATSVGRNCVTPDTSTMWYEQYVGSTYYHHPNQKGSMNMYGQLLLDTPEIF